MKLRVKSHHHSLIPYSTVSYRHGRKLSRPLNARVLPGGTRSILSLENFQLRMSPLGYTMTPPSAQPVRHPHMARDAAMENRVGWYRQYVGYSTVTVSQNSNMCHITSREDTPHAMQGFAILCCVYSCALEYAGFPLASAPAPSHTHRLSLMMVYARYCIQLLKCTCE